mmetsp:Transcript_2822/g.11366  ORF Transcript_2822/g.11366 Transcript_2822/m.11366 type:complete len:229 (-) Transcript_2822:1457-2143(-)
MPRVVMTSRSEIRRVWSRPRARRLRASREAPTALRSTSWAAMPPMVRREARRLRLRGEGPVAPAAAAAEEDDDDEKEEEEKPGVSAWAGGSMDVAAAAETGDCDGVVEAEDTVSAGARRGCWPPKGAREPWAPADAAAAAEDAGAAAWAEIRAAAAGAAGVPSAATATAAAAVAEPSAAGRPLCAPSPARLQLGGAVALARTGPEGAVPAGRAGASSGRNSSAGMRAA